MRQRNGFLSGHRVTVKRKSVILNQLCTRGILPLEVMKASRVNADLILDAITLHDYYSHVDTDPIKCNWFILFCCSFMKTLSFPQLNGNQRASRISILIGTRWRYFDKNKLSTVQLISKFSLVKKCFDFTKRASVVIATTLCTSRQLHFQIDNDS